MQAALTPPPPRPAARPLGAADTLHAAAPLHAVTTLHPATTLLPLGLLLVAALGAFGWLHGIALPLPRLLFPAAAFLCYGAAGLTASRTGSPLALIWTIAVLARLALLPLAPELSDDIYRYLWDGHVLASGINPYGYAPADEALASIRTPWHGEINHPEVPTIYPPLAQFLFAAVAMAGGGSILAAKVLWLGFDLGCGLLLHRIAERTGRNPAPVLLWYLWSPLLIVETAWSAHFDAVGLFLMAALILACSRGPGRDGGAGHATRRALSLGGAVSVGLIRALTRGALLAAASLVKFAPAAALPALVRRHGWATLFAFAAVCAAFYLPFASVGTAALTEGLRTYGRHWLANEGAFAVIAALIRDPVHARAAATMLVLAVVAWVTWRRFAIERALLWIVGAGLLLSPTVHPWYTLWVLPMAALRGSRPFLLLGGLAFIGYWGLAAYELTGVWPQPLWSRVAMWLPVWAWLLSAKIGRKWRTNPS